MNSTRRDANHGRHGVYQHAAPARAANQNKHLITFSRSDCDTPVLVQRFLLLPASLFVCKYPSFQIQPPARPDFVSSPRESNPSRHHLVGSSPAYASTCKVQNYSDGVGKKELRRLVSGRQKHIISGFVEVMLWFNGSSIHVSVDGASKCFSCFCCAFPTLRWFSVCFAPQYTGTILACCVFILACELGRRQCLTSCTSTERGATVLNHTGQERACSTRDESKKTTGSKSIVKVVGKHQRKRPREIRRSPQPSNSTGGAIQLLPQKASVVNHAN